MTSEKPELIEELRARLRDVTALPDEPTFFTEQETLVRYLRARDWQLDAAEKLLRSTVEWRRSNRPLHMSCKWCHTRPGYHSLRQVGFDYQDRPVIYSCFAQTSTHKNLIEDTVTHVAYLIENAKLTMKRGVSQWVFVIDCTGMTLPTCSPKLGYGVTQVMSNHYPERLGLVICVNHSPVFQGVWNAVKVFLHPNTVAKMQLIRRKSKLAEIFAKHFSPELQKWLLEEIKLNKSRPLAQSQREFWKGPMSPMDHDPRGCQSYVTDHVEPYAVLQRSPDRVHKPHPNMVDFFEGRVVSAAEDDRDSGIEEAATATGADDLNDSFEELDINGTGVKEIHIAEEYQIPKSATRL